MPLLGERMRCAGVWDGESIAARAGSAAALTRGLSRGPGEQVLSDGHNLVYVVLRFQLGNCTIQADRHLLDELEEGLWLESRRF